MSRPRPEYLSGPPIEDFAGGWALFPLVGRRVHLWTRTEVSDAVRRSAEMPDDMVLWTARCGASGYTTDTVPALRRGSWPLCKSCERARARSEVITEKQRQALAA